MSPVLDSLTQRLSQLYTGAVHDVLRGLGHDNCVLPTELRPPDPALKVAGRVWTVSGHIDPPLPPPAHPTWFPSPRPPGSPRRNPAIS